MKKIKKNYHKAEEYTWEKVLQMIADYPKKYPTPKYLIFIRTLLELGWEVKVYVVQVSKYVFVSKGGLTYKIRFSNHKPIYYKEMEEDCDFYVGVSHKQVSTTEQILQALKNKEESTVTAFGYVLGLALKGKKI